MQSSLHHLGSISWGQTKALTPSHLDKTGLDKSKKYGSRKHRSQSQGQTTFLWRHKLHHDNLPISGVFKDVSQYLSALSWEPSEGLIFRDELWLLTAREDKASEIVSAKARSFPCSQVDAGQLTQG